MELYVLKNTKNIKINASQLISNMICIKYDHNKKFWLLKFHWGYGNFNLNSLKGYSLKKLTRRLLATPVKALCLQR